MRKYLLYTYWAENSLNNWPQGCSFFSSLMDSPIHFNTIKFETVNLEIFARVLFSRNSAYEVS